MISHTLTREAYMNVVYNLSREWDSSHAECVMATYNILRAESSDMVNWMYTFEDA